ncbi:MAG: hypothetical protein R3A47_01760 [Polyangiales bacterium]
MSQSDIDRWVSCSREAKSVISHKPIKQPRASRTSKKCKKSLTAAAELNREAARARQVLDTCLYMVRAYVETGDTSTRVNGRTSMPSFMPSVEPSAYRHTPEVRDLLASVDREMAEETGASRSHERAHDRLCRASERHRVRSHAGRAR